MYRSYKDQGLVFLGIHCDEWDGALKAVKDESIEYPVFNDVDSKSQTVFAINGYPTIYVIDKKGVVRYMDPPDLSEVVKELLAE